MVYELVQYRQLLFMLTWRDIRIRYKQAVMGFAWAMLMPIVIVGAGFVVKYAMAQMSGSQIDVGGFAGMAVKAMPWAFFVGAIGFATNSLISNRNLVTKIYFPREVFPLSAVLAQTFDTSVGSSVVALLLFLFLGVGSSFQILWVIPLVILLFLFTTGMALFLRQKRQYLLKVCHRCTLIVMPINEGKVYRLILRQHMWQRILKPTNPHENSTQAKRFKAFCRN